MSVSGDVYEPKRRKNFMDLTMLHGIPVAESPIFILERTELEFGQERSDRVKTV